jgi:hypothetical protein
MSLLGRTSTAVFRAPSPISERQAFSEQRVQGVARLRASTFVRAQYLSRGSGPGYRLRVSGLVSLKGPQARLRFRPGDGAEVDESVEPEVLNTPLLAVGASFSIPERVLNRPGETSPLVWISFVDHENAPLTSPICIGHAGSDSRHVDPYFELPAVATLWLTPRRMLRSGPQLEMSGELVLRDGIVMRIALAQSSNRFGTPALPCEGFDVVVAARGARLAITRRRVSAVVRGHPFVSLALRDWDGSDAGGEMPVGWIIELKN